MRINIMIQSFRGGNTCVKLNVNPTDSVSKVLGRYLRTELGTRIPDYLERSFFVGQNVELNDARTIGQSCILQGDTLHAVLRVQTLKIVVINVHTRDLRVVDTLSTCSVLKLKKLFREKLSPSKRIPVKNTMLKFGNEVLEDEKILAHYDIHNYDTIYMYTQFNINVLVPNPIVRREKIVAESHFTIRDIKKKVKSLGHCTQLYHPVLRAAVQSATGTHLYMCFDLFPSDDEDTMQVFVDEFNDEQSVNRFRFSVAYDSKIDDIYNKIEAGQGQNKDESVNDDVEWPPCHTFNRSWVRTFFPRVETESCSLLERGALNLFFFCFQSKKCQLFVASCDTVGQVKEFICRTQGISAERIWCLPNRPFMDGCNWYDYQRVLQDEINCFRLQRPEFKGGSIMIYIRWATSDTAVLVEVDPDQTVYSVKDRIEHHLGVPICMQILIFKDRELEDKSILRVLEIENNSILELCLNHVPSEYMIIETEEEWNI